MIDIQAAIDAAGSAGKVALFGYCWGGSLAYLAAARLNGLACAIGYYGAQIAGHSNENVLRMPTLLHYAEVDEYIPQADIEKVAVTIYQYPGTEHGFNCDDRKFWEPKAAALAATDARLHPPARRLKSGTRATARKSAAYSGGDADVDGLCSRHRC